MNEARIFLKSILNNDDYVVVACSGGPDSMYLMELVNSLKNELNLTVICAHVNHGLREESILEAEMVKDYANKNDDIFELFEITEYKESKFSEADARMKRYEFFKSLLKKYNSRTLLTAHHGDDLIETILMRISRGSNLSGYAGIRKVTENENYKIVRPLLNLSKEDIIKYLDVNNITCAIDKSNESNNYTRNRYRHNVVSFLHNEDKDIQEKYVKFSEELISYEKFVNDYIKENNFIVDNSIVVNNINNDFILRKCIELLVKDIQARDFFDISDNEIKEVLKLKNNENKSIDLNNGYKAINSYGKLMIIKDEDNIFLETILNKDISIYEYIFYYNTKEGDNTNSCIYLDSNEVSLPLKIRPIKPGDKMVVKNLNGSKKISDILINSKVPNYKRKNYPILVDNENNILWIPNIKKSQFAKDKSEKYDIIVKCEER